ncbi:hypothetical protein L1887_42366 [Cichorium endivia]|nr:hypothetical protein L1887_42366 [Cichorium endivia]
MCHEKKCHLIGAVEHDGGSAGEVELHKVSTTVPLHVGSKPFCVVVDPSMATELLCIGVEQHLVLSWHIHADPVVGVGVVGVPVEHEQKAGTLECHDAVRLVLERDVRLRARKPLVLALGIVHGGVECVQVLVPEQAVVNEVELATRVVERVAVALAREVEPLGVTELVADKVEVALAAERMCDETDHLVVRQAAVDDGGALGEVRHIGVHLLVHEPEGKRLVADERLVVRLGIGDRLFQMTSVGEREADVAKVPVLVRLFLEQLDPHVWHGHREAVVEANTALRDGSAQRRHARDVLGDGDGVGVVLVDHVVGEHEVGDGLDVDGRAKVLVVAAAESGADAVVRVEHGGDAVEAETIESVLLHPEEAVAEQEAQHLVVAIVEQARVPELVPALGALVEVEVVGAVKHVEAVEHILARVRVDNVEEYGDTHGMRNVDELLEVLGVAVPAAGGKEVGDLVAKRGVVGVLLDGHELDGVVAELLDTRQDVLCEFFELADARLGSGDADVCLVDLDVIGLGRLGVLDGVALLLGRVPEARVVHGRNVQILRDAEDPCWQTLDPLARGQEHGDLELGVMWDGAGGIGKRRDGDVPLAVVILGHLVRVARPVVKVADERRLDGVGRPFGVGDGLCLGIHLEAHVAVGARESLEAALGGTDLALPVLVQRVSLSQRGRERLEPRIAADDAGAIGSLGVVGRRRDGRG